jgi:hypothetical protein
MQDATRSGRNQLVPARPDPEGAISRRVTPDGKIHARKPIFASFDGKLIARSTIHGDIVEMHSSAVSQNRHRIKAISNYGDFSES